MSQIKMDVDIVLPEIPINMLPLVDDTDFKTIEDGVVYNQAGLDLNWNFTTTDGLTTQTNVTPTTASGSDYEWVNQGNGMYGIAAPDTGGASINNDTEGFGWFSGVATGILPWRGPVITFRAAALNDALIDGGDVLDVNLTEMSSSAQSATDLKDFADAGYDPGTNKVQGVVLTDATTAVSNQVTANVTAMAANVVTAAAIAAAAIDNATFAADVGSTAYATNIIALAVRKALDEIRLDHLVAIADADDVVDDSIMAKLASKSNPANWSSFDNTTDALEAISDKVVAASPQAHFATADSTITGTLNSGAYTDTTSVNSVYIQVSPVTPAVGGFGLNEVLTFSVGTGTDRSPDSVTITGYFDSGALRTVQIWAYDYMAAGWVQLSNSETDFGNAGSNQSFGYPLTANMIQVSDGEMQIRATSTSTNIGDEWFWDFVEVNSVAVEAAGLTADSIQQAVWARTDEGHDENTLGYNLSAMHLVHGSIVSATDATQFVIDFNIPANDIYNGMVITMEDKTDGHYESRRIVDTIAASNEIFVDRVFGFTPVVSDDYYILNNAYANSNTTHVAGTAQTANDNGADINATLADTNELQTNQGNWLTATGFSTHSVADVWNEVLIKATYDISNSAAKRLRALSEIVIRCNTAQGPGTGNNQIQLDAGASAVDGAYDPAIVYIIGGTGIGQTRLILQYSGGSKTATIDRDWKVSPDATSEFHIIANPGRRSVNEGLAQGPGTGNNQIQLNTLASSSNNVYRGQMVFLRSGTGQDQAALILSYIGATKIATIDGTWATNPDATTGYVVSPSSPVLLATATQASIDAIEADTNELQANQGNWLTATGFSTHSAANVRAEMDSNSTQLQAVIADTQDIQSRLPAALVGGKINADTTAISGSTDAADKLEAAAEVTLTGAAIGGTLSTTQMTTDLTVTVADQFNGRYLAFKEDTTTVALRGQVTEITDTEVASSRLTFTALTTAPVVGDTFVVT